MGEAVQIKVLLMHGGVFFLSHRLSFLTKRFFQKEPRSTREVTGTKMSQWMWQNNRRL